MKFTSYLTGKILRNSCEGIWVRQSGINKVKELLAKGERVVLMPMFKSYVDALVIAYSLIDSGIKLPFTIGCAEDTYNIKLVNALANSMGIILNQRQVDHSAES
jgi:glycerol-3-phosphate O-acyltransferase